MEKKKSKLSDSFVVGVIALVFLIVGYQTAMFVYRASVMKIVSNRDEPDTVYIYGSLDSHVADVFQNDVGKVRDTSLRGPEPSVNVKVNTPAVQRKSSSHSTIAETVRQAAPRRRVESFRFNPNTVTKEDLRRLGFSEKQA
jgi:hypothetical protein